MIRSDVYNCDCVEYMRSLPDKTFDMAIADPPYGDAAVNEGVSPPPYRINDRNTTGSEGGSTHIKRGNHSIFFRRTGTYSYQSKKA